jgi:hypothetical protein
VAFPLDLQPTAYRLQPYLQLAGAEGFEPPNGGIKTRCLTTWRRPNISFIVQPTLSASVAFERYELRYPFLSQTIQQWRAVHTSNQKPAPSRR